MNIRTLSREDTIHVINLSCMVLAWGVSCFYFEATAPDKAVATLGDVLLSPYYFVDRFCDSFLHVNLTNNALFLFIILWLSYFLLGIRLTNFLMVKNHETSELKSWYFARKRYN